MEIANLMQNISNDFIKLGCESLSNDSNMGLKPRNHCILDAGCEVDDDVLAIEMDEGVRNRFIKLQKVNKATPVFGIDTSNIILGDTYQGLLCAVRGSIVWKEKQTYQYVRHGPFIFNITEKNKHTLHQMLNRINITRETAVGVPLFERLINRIRFILERWLQKQTGEMTQDSLILWDGSLTTQTVDNSPSGLNDLLQTARMNHNYILAFSKQTKFLVSGRRLTDLIDDESSPCLVNIDDSVSSNSGSRLHHLGRIYATKLSPGPFTFRLDIDKCIPEADSFNALGRLLENELLTDSYPETLRLAHIFSRFSASEVLAMQRYVANSYGVQIDPKSDVRKVLFGPYGGSSYKRLNEYDANL